MRVIAGKFKKANLVTVKSRDTRPTTDFLKEVIFSVLGDCNVKLVLDLYAGSGALGLEALSRGAERTLFVDMSMNAIKAMKTNVHKLKCEEDCHIYKKKVSAFLKVRNEKFDLIFMDPPYNKGLINSTIELIFQNKLLAEKGRIVVERSRNESLAEEWHDLVVYDKRYGDNVVTVLKNYVKE
jgi:16S rRNA (guanine966-N2)-methyltransferase